MNATDTAASIRRSVPMFQEHQPRNFAYHFRTTKAKYGLYATNKSNAKHRPTYGNEEDDEDIPELYG
ncbi:hypothetical protein Bhyg_07702 [Pseudolycoriella hygida]|uniref:Uncharacterized protein n=1 Tax=Pseudolycoriella hygida TaxID=35572 RepID=A0A9Q0S3L7_9DIPT|nr:hypothetical protein Bhyg_07702 [Pseudolycoriella hygida]